MAVSDNLIKIILRDKYTLIFIHVRTDAKAEAPILWPFDAKSQLTGKDHDAGKD